MSTRLKWILGIIGTVLLGALGSGLWDMCLRDLFIWIGRGILTLITLGIGSVRDSNYIEIAKGHTDRVSIYLVSFGMIFLGMVTGAAMFLLTFKTRSATLSVTASQYRFVRWTLILMLFFLTSTFWFRFALISYSASAVDHFEQAYTICLPFMSAPERDTIRSQFARIKSKADYVAILTTLRQKADENKVELPKFSVW